MPSLYSIPSLSGRQRLSPLPSFSNAVHEKHHLTSSSREYRTSWMTRVEIPIPFVSSRRIQLIVPLPPRFVGTVLPSPRSGRKRSGIVLILIAFLFLWTIFAFTKRFATRSKTWPQPFSGDPPTLVYERADLRRMWLWEIASGHYPSNRPLPVAIGFQSMPLNPGIPKPQKNDLSSLLNATTIGTGVSRTYFHANVTDPSFPPRPVPGSVLDLDIVLDNCEFTTNQYVRDCLEVLRMGAGLDNGKSIRRGNTDKWKHIFTEGKDADGMSQTTPVLAHFLEEPNPNEGLEFSRKAPREPPFLNYPPPKPSTPYPLIENGPCDPARPRIYHIFWAGPFTDKPYIAILSFLFTQNVGLHLPRNAPPSREVCRPQIWLWINPGPAAAIANPRARSDMYETLAANPWSAPFLHPRFEDVVKFKLWNTTEQLDGVPEIKDEWRIFGGSIFNSGGYVYEVKIDKEAERVSAADTSSVANDTLPTAEEPKKQQKNGIYDRLGSKSQQDYDRMSVILSDMARFILCHRFGGTYLDADTIFLRDWEELWGWKGAFAYRWSRLEKYNTAVLRLNKGSALGSFLFRTALKNDFDFHPMTVSRYTQEAHMEGLLLRLPDALFDSAWLNTEGFQNDRPPFPYLTDFHHLFSLPREHGAAPLALGFEGFFRGAFSYHFHNYWWEPFDPSRNWPDLGQRFIKSERKGREEAAAATVAAAADPKVLPQPIPDPHLHVEENVTDDIRDLSWATVLKRTFEAYIRGERPNMYGEYINWS